MPVLAAGDIVQITYTGYCLDQEIQFSRHYKAFTSSAADVSQALQAIANCVGGVNANGGPIDLTTDYFGFLPSAYVCTSIKAKRLYPAASAYFEYKTSQAGTGGTGPRTDNLAATFALATVLPGRKQVAKYHPGPMPNSFWGDGYLLTAGEIALRLLADACVAPFAFIVGAEDPITMTPVIYHRSPNANPKFNEVIQNRVNDTVRTMRRRTIGIGS